MEISPLTPSTPNPTGLSRRSFIRAGAIGIGAVALPTLSAAATGEAAGTAFAAGLSHRTLATRRLEIRFDPQSGLPSRYRLPVLGRNLRGETFRGAELATISPTQWQYQSGRNSGELEHDIHVTQLDGASFELTFTGTGVEYVTDLNTDKGPLDMFIDGVLVETVNAYHPTRVWQASVFSRTGLASGSHTLKGVKRGGEYAIVDGFKVHTDAGVITLNDTDTGVHYSTQQGFLHNIGAVVTKVATRTEFPADAALDRITVTGRRAVVSYRLTVGETLVGSFALHYAVTGTSVQVKLADVVEERGWELVEVHTPSLVTVTAEDADAWIAHGDGGGLLAPLSSALESSLPYGTRGSFPNLSILPLVLLGHRGAAAAVEIQGYLSNTALNLYPRDGQLVSTVGAVTLHRVPGGATTPSLLVEQQEVARLDFVGDLDRSGVVDWLDAAKLVKERIHRNPTSYYDDKFLYAVQGQVGPVDRTEPRNTFAEIDALVRRVSSLIDGQPQVVFVAGWPPGGHDTSYPAVYPVNPELGGKAGWDRLQADARRHYNANVTLDDNWDDQYRNTYTEGVFDPAFIERTSDGELERQTAWNGVDLSYITGFAKYMVDGGPGLRRARFTIDYYELQHAALVDAMSWWSIRNDWDPEHPASAVKNLSDGKFKLIDAYAERGVHLGSELLRYPFVGKLAFTMDGPTGGGWNGFGGSAIPLVSLLLRHSTTYGIDSGSSPTPRTTLFHNNRTHTWLDKTTPDTMITDLYYLNYLPWMRLHDQPVQTFVRDGGTITIGLGHGTSIHLDDDAGTQRVLDRGVEILNGNSVTIPMDRHRIAFYADAEATLSYPLPQGWPTGLTARRLTASGPVTHPVTVTAGRIHVDVPAQTPVIVATSRGGAGTTASPSHQ